MGSVLTCCPWHRLCAAYQPLSEAHELTLGADEARIQAIAEVDDALLREPAIQAAMNAGGSDDGLNEDELAAALKEIGV
jgi:hypothetical protein